MGTVSLRRTTTESLHINPLSAAADEHLKCSLADRTLLVTEALDGIIEWIAEEAGGR